MIILNEVQPKVFKEIDKINEHLAKNKKVKSMAHIHGTFNMDLKRLKKGEIKYATDVDCEVWNQFIGNNKKDLFENFFYIYDYLLETKKYYFVDLIAGEDDRFVFDFYIKKTGEIINYDAKEIRQRFQKLYKDKVITKDELDKLLEYVLDEPTLISFEKLKQVLEKFKDLHWTVEEIYKKEKFYRKKTFNLYDLFMKRIFLSSFILEFERGKYILFDLAYRVFSIEKNYENINLKNKDYLYDTILAKTTTYGEEPRSSTVHLYNGIFKNYVQAKYLKMLKRLRSILTFNFYEHFNTVNNSNKKLKDPERKMFIGKIRRQIQLITTSLEYSCLNQLKNRVDIILTLIEKKYKSDDEIIRLILELLKDSVYSCNYSNRYVIELHNKLSKTKNLSLNKNKEDIIELLKNYKSEMFKYLNNKTLPHLQKFMYELRFLLPFNLELPLPKNK